MQVPSWRHIGCHTEKNRYYTFSKLRHGIVPCVGDVALEKAAGLIDIWTLGLVVWFSLRVREDSGSIPGAALDDHQTLILTGKQQRSPGHWPREAQGRWVGTSGRPGCG